MNTAITYNSPVILPLLVFPAFNVYSEPGEKRSRRRHRGIETNERERAVLLPRRRRRLGRLEVESRSRLEVLDVRARLEVVRDGAEEVQFRSGFELVGPSADPSALQVFESVVDVSRNRKWLNDTQPNDTKNNDTQHNKTKHYDTQHNNTKHNDT